MIENVDKSEVVSPHLIESPVLGPISVKEISGGVKTLILMAFDETGCFLQALFPQKCRLTSSKLHGEFPQYCISSSGTLLGAGEEPLQAYKVY